MDIKTIDFFKQKLEDRLDELLSQAKQTIAEFIEQNTREVEHLDHASASAHQAFKLRLRNRESKLIKKIKEALERIEDGTYGICELCGKEISLKRLEVRPVTTKCIECKEREEQSELLTQ